MAKRVLDVGSCYPDHMAIAALITEHFDAEVLRAHQLEDALALLQAEPVDLVLVNRRLDRDNSDGLDVIRAIKSDPHLARIPVMMVTNYPEHQRRAEAAGAARGFGKARLYEPDTLDRLATFLRS